MSRATTKPKPRPADPLADLRPAEDDAGHTPNSPEPVDEVTRERPTAPGAFHDEARAEIVAAFHADPVATGMLHKGGTCGCRYLARLALQTALGAPQEAVQALEDPEGRDDG